MTLGEPDLIELGTPRPVGSRSGALAVRVLCPYLQSDAGWRSTSATRDLHCQAVRPAVRLALDKQRRLCLREAHLECSTYIAARSARAAAGSTRSAADPDGDRAPMGPWNFMRTAPAVIGDGRISLPVEIAGRERTVPQAGLGAVLVGALAILVVTRLAGDTGTGTSAIAASPSASSSQAAVVVPSPTDAPTSTPAPPSPSAIVPPSTAPTATPIASPTGEVAGATATAPGRTYRVRSGDTLFAIAQRFGTTVRAIQELNGIDDPSRLHVGQVLLIP
ncbi:MAG TPA: LysM domain-containing protein [Candidatus Limnocylindrales bacterium]|jgi:LysM repeat protein